VSKAIFDSRLPAINRAIEQFAVSGFRAEMVHRNLDWMQALNIEYDASCFDVDPFQAMPGGVGGIWPFGVGKFVELPYTLPQDHTRFVSLGETTTRIWEARLAFVRKHHGMALMLMHPDYLCPQNGLKLYVAFLSEVLESATLGTFCRVRWRAGTWASIGKEIGRTVRSAVLHSVV